jgi:hypothetical protein
LGKQRGTKDEFNIQHGTVICAGSDLTWFGSTAVPSIAISDKTIAA